MQPKLEAQDIRLEYFQPRTNTRLLALGGVTLKVLQGTRYPVVSTWLYLGMGWLMISAIQPLCQRLPAPGIWLLVGGGLFYTGGLGFYAARELPYRHFFWHLLVLAGTACHFFAIMLYALPAA